MFPEMALQIHAPPEEQVVLVVLVPRAAQVVIATLTVNRPDDKDAPALLAQVAMQALLVTPEHPLTVYVKHSQGAQVVLAALAAMEGAVVLAALAGALLTVIALLLRILLTGQGADPELPAVLPDLMVVQVGAERAQQIAQAVLLGAILAAELAVGFHVGEVIPALPLMLPVLAVVVVVALRQAIQSPEVVVVVVAVVIWEIPAVQAVLAARQIRLLSTAKPLPPALLIQYLLALLEGR
jgi:hypothetical protein